MSKTLFILDPGHGGILNGVNQSKDGKYSPKFTDGTKFEYKGQSFDRFYEGANNRDNAERIIQKLKAVGLDAIDITGGSQSDVPLRTRTDAANKYHPNRKCVYISIHSDALGIGEQWQPASGISVYTSKGQTKSDIFATIVIDRLQARYTDVKWRTDNQDGDEDKEENFFVLRETKMPAILIEGGFHTNESEVKKMMTEDWKAKLSDAVVEACLIWEKMNT